MMQLYASFSGGCARPHHSARPHAPTPPQVMELLAEHLACWGCHIAFPELAFLTAAQLRRFMKATPVERFRWALVGWGRQLAQPAGLEQGCRSPASPLPPAAAHRRLASPPHPPVRAGRLQRRWWRRWTATPRGWAARATRWTLALKTWHRWRRSWGPRPRRARCALPGGHVQGCQLLAWGRWGPARVGCCPTSCAGLLDPAHSPHPIPPTCRTSRPPSSSMRRR